jgi:hypothetical protein
MFRSGTEVGGKENGFEASVGKQLGLDVRANSLRDSRQGDRSARDGSQEKLSHETVPGFESEASGDRENCDQKRNAEYDYPQ